MRKSAFTMLELVMVIIVIGIISSLALPRISRDISQEASDIVLSAIRYTQHLALMDDKTNPTDGNWQQKLWQIQFSNSGGKWFYTISSDTNQDQVVDKEETAVDPVNGKRFYNENSDDTIDLDDSPNVFLSQKFEINSVDFTGVGCSSKKQIAFDHLGRPFSNIDNATNDFAKYMSTDCKITIGFDGSADVKIIIKKETGYSFIEGQNNS